MSITGTGVAAGVAQTSLQSQQLGRKRDAQKAATAHTREQEKQRFDSKAHSTGQTEDSDAELPDNQAPGYEQLYGRPQTPQQQAAPQDAEASHGNASPAEDSTQPLYRHVDIRV